MVLGSKTKKNFNLVPFFAYLGKKQTSRWRCENHTVEKSNTVDTRLQNSLWILTVNSNSQNTRVWLRWNPVDNWVSCVLWQRALRSWVTRGAASPDARLSVAGLCTLEWTKSTSEKRSWGHFEKYFFWIFVLFDFFIFLPPYFFGFFLEHL